LMIRLTTRSLSADRLNPPDSLMGLGFDMIESFPLYL
jgi:hypothetical protein